QITAGHNRNYRLGNLYTQNVIEISFQTGAAVILGFVPGFQIHDQVNLLAHLNRADTENACNVNDTDAAQLDKVTDVFRSRTHDGAAGCAAQLHGVIGNQAMATFDQLHSGLTLAYATVTQNQDALAVNFNENTVTGNTGGQLHIQQTDQSTHQG